MRHPNRSRSRRGLGLIEIAVSVGILSVALLSTLATMHFGMASGNHGAIMSDAVGYGKQLLEIMLQENRAFAVAGLPPSSSGYNDLSGSTRPLNDPPFSAVNYMLPGNSRFSRNIQVLNCRMSTETAGGYAWKDDLREVLVTISWTENARPRAVTLRSYCKRPR